MNISKTMMCTQRIGNVLCVTVSNRFIKYTNTAKISNALCRVGLERTFPLLVTRVQPAASFQTWHGRSEIGVWLNFLKKEKISRFGVIEKAPQFVSSSHGPGGMSHGADIKTICSSAGDPDSRNCHHDEMVELVENGGATIIDVRRADEIQATGIMDGAHHIPLDELKQAFELPGDKFEERYGLKRSDTDGAEIVFTCRSGRRSLIALEIAKGFGFTKARHYPGGWNSWAEKTKL